MGQGKRIRIEEEKSRKRDGEEGSGHLCEENKDKTGKRKTEKTRVGKRNTTRIAKMRSRTKRTRIENKERERGMRTMKKGRKSQQ